MTPLSCLLLKLDHCLEISPGLVHDSAKLHLMSITLCGVITRLFPLPFILSCPLCREPHPPNTHKINHILLNQPQTHQFIDSCPVSMVHDTGLFPQSSSFVSLCLPVRSTGSLVLGIQRRTGMSWMNWSNLLFF